MKKSYTIESIEIGLNPKFVRRTDLTEQTRLYIAYTALTAQLLGSWGVVTALANEFRISRTFVYILACGLSEILPILFGPSIPTSTLPDERKLAIAEALSLRFEGKCSIEAISTIMERRGLKPSSTGSLSQIFKNIGSLLPNTLITEDGEVRLVVFLSDEIFSKTTPILVTVEPRSSAILRIEIADKRSVEEWKTHWQCLEQNGFMATYLVCDEGTALCGAHREVLSDVVRQLDTYHAIAHRLGQWVERLERAAYNALEREDERYKKLDSARSDRVLAKRIDQYEEARREADKAVDLYEDFSYLYVCVLKELQLFDINGTLRDRKQAEQGVESGLDLIDGLGHENIKQANCKIRRILPELFNFFDVAKNVVTGFDSMVINKEALRALCLAWQSRKARIKAKKADRSKWHADQEQSFLEFAEGHLQEEYEVVKKHVYWQLDQIVQSSAMVECINSIIRPYLNNSKNQVTQETLNLIMFYHNHRRYRDGERKNQTPMEILTGKKEEKDWIELLFEIVEEKDQTFLLATR